MQKRDAKKILSIIGGKSKRRFLRCCAVVSWIQAVNQIVLRAYGGIGRRQANCDFNSVTGVSVMDALGIVAPRVKMTFDRFGQSACVTLANVENFVRAFRADDIRAGLVAESIQPLGEV